MSTNFGVVELASTRTTNAPGWAYVPDLSIQAAALKQGAGGGAGGGNRKRAARNQPNASLSDLTARQATKVRRELEALDKDSHRDANIAVPPRPGAGSTRTQNKHTPNVRKILMSQKTFANHLDDYFAMQALHDNNSPHPSAPSAAAAGTASRRPAPSSSSGPSNKKKKVATPAVEEATPADNDTPMPDASQEEESTLLAPYTGRLPPPGPADTDPLLASRVPPLPTDAELRALLAAPPLAYGEARGEISEAGRRYPGRTFCEVCGYWGRVACLKCGTRVCALECLEVHREECFTRYGA